MTRAVATGAGDVAGFSECWAQPLAGQFEQSEAADLGGLNPGAVMAQRITQAVFHLALVFGRIHVDEIDHDQAAQVAQAQLTGDLVRRLEIGPEGGFLDVRAFGRASGVDVDRHQRFSVIDHDRAARWQRDLPGVGGFDLMLDLEARK